MTNARREPRRPQRQPDQGGVPAAGQARASRVSIRSSPGSRSRTWPTCSRPTSRSSTATSATSTSARRAVGLLDGNGHRDRAAHRPGDNCYRKTADAVRRGVPHVLQAPRRGRHHAGQHIVHDRRGGERPVRRRNVGRAIQPARRGRRHRDDSPRRAIYAAGQIGELATNIKGLLAHKNQHDAVRRSSRKAPAIYVTGTAGSDDPAVRQLERDIASMTNPNNPFTGNETRRSRRTWPGSVEQRVLHPVNADPLEHRPTRCSRNPITSSARTSRARRPCTHRAPRTRWAERRASPGITGTAPTIDITWVGFVGPGVAHIGLDGPQATDGPAIHDPNGGGTVPEFSTKGRGSISPTSARRSCGWRGYRTATSTTGAC